VRWRSTRFRLLQSAGRFQVLADSSRTYEPYQLSVPDVQAMGADLQFALGHVGRLPFVDALRVGVIPQLGDSSGTGTRYDRSSNWNA
jgi:hypothetical protein